MAKTLVGVVTSNATDKTIVITVHTRKTHPIYKKQYTVTSKFMAHDGKNECQIGDRVSIVETKPLSARKRFKLDKILSKTSLTEDDKKELSKNESEERAKEIEAQRRQKREEKKKLESKEAEISKEKEV